MTYIDTAAIRAADAHLIRRPEHQACCDLVLALCDALDADRADLAAARREAAKWVPATGARRWAGGWRLHWEALARWCFWAWEEGELARSNWDFWRRTALDAEAERDEARAALARVEALPPTDDEDPNGGYRNGYRLAMHRVRTAIAEPDPTDHNGCPGCPGCGDATDPDPCDACADTLDEVRAFRRTHR